MMKAPPNPWTSLQRVIRAQRLNYAKVAALSGLSPSYVSHLANGRRRPTSDAITKLAAALSIPEQVLAVGVVSTTPDEIRVEIGELIDALRQQMDTAIDEITAKREHLEQLAQQGSAA